MKSNKQPRQFTFMNHGTPFIFNDDRYAKKIGSLKGHSMLSIHAELVLEAMQNGDKGVQLLDEFGNVIDKTTLKKMT